MTGNVDDAAQLLAGARREGRRVLVPPGLRPSALDEAYAIQDAIGRILFPATVSARGWKVGAPDAHTQPNAAPIYRVTDSPAEFPASSMTMIGVEAEIAVVFAHPLPPRTAPYGTEEALSAVGEVRVAIEVCDTRLDDWQTADDYTKLADHQLNFALVLGDAAARKDQIDFRALAVRTILDGKVLKEGVGCHALDNPLTLLPWLANHARLRGGIAVGTAVTTGSWLGMHFIAPGATVVVEFPALGRAQVSFPA
jgi:2-keto-4-pentenoate hydratase